MRFLIGLLISTLPFLASAQQDYDYTFYSGGVLHAFPVAKDTSRETLVYKVEKNGGALTICEIGNPTKIQYSGSVKFVGSTPTNQALLYDGDKGVRIVIQPLFGCAIIIDGPDAQNPTKEGANPLTNRYHIFGGCTFDPSIKVSAQTPTVKKE